MPEEITAQENETPEELMARIEAAEADPEPKDAAPPPKIKIGEEEFSEEDLKAQLADARRAKEIEAGGRKAFEDAATERKALDAERQQVQDLALLRQSWESGDPTAQKMILDFLGTEAGTKTEETSDLEDPTENETALQRAIRETRAETTREIAQLRGQLQALAPVLGELKEFTEAEKGTRVEQSVIADVKAKFGIDITPEKVKELKGKGLDPIAFYEEAAPLVQAGLKSGAEKARKGNELPEGTLADDQFDPDDPTLGPDQILRLLESGKRPSK
jgi:hypothetical protein